MKIEGKSTTTSPMSISSSAKWVCLRFHGLNSNIQRNVHTICLFNCGTAIQVENVVIKSPPSLIFLIGLFSVCYLSGKSEPCICGGWGKKGENSP